MKNAAICLFSLLVVACGFSDGIDGRYVRKDATPFEEQQGMSRALNVYGEGESMVLENAWGDVPLAVEPDGKKFVVMMNGQAAYSVAFQNGEAVISDLIATENVYRFVKE
ncbi:MAG: hypothetical protein Q4D63_01955 [Neisseria animaloris]|nr:hypothetical protein [Neisseria animaloris]